MKRLIITEEEKRNILLKHGSKSVLSEAAKDDIMAIQKTLGLTADGVAGPKTISSILTKLGGGATTPVASTPTSAATTPTSAATTPTSATTTPVATTPTTPTTPAAGATFSAVPVAGAATLEAACGDRKTNKDFRLCRKVFKKTTK